MAITAAHRAQMKETREKDKKEKTRREHCNRINRFVNWLHQKYPDYYTQGVRELTEEELQDEDRFYQGC